MAEEYKSPFDYEHCRVCGVVVSEERQKHFRRMIENAHCGSRACIQKEIVDRFGCCDKAELMNCVCAYAFRCPVHGQRHIGTHD